MTSPSNHPEKIAVRSDQIAAALLRCRQPPRPPDCSLIPNRPGRAAHLSQLPTAAAQAARDLGIPVGRPAADGFRDHGDLYLVASDRPRVAVRAGAR